MNLWVTDKRIKNEFTKHCLPLNVGTLSAQFSKFVLDSFIRNQFKQKLFSQLPVYLCSNRNHRKHGDIK